MEPRKTLSGFAVPALLPDDQPAQCGPAAVSGFVTSLGECVVTPRARFAEHPATATESNQES